MLRKEFDKSSINMVYNKKTKLLTIFSDEDIARIGQNSYRTQLMIQHINTKNLKALLWMYEHEYPLDAADENGVTPLMAAATCGYADIVKFLLTHDVDTTKKNNDGNSAYDLALLNGHTKVAKKIKQAAEKKNISLSTAPHAVTFSAKNRGFELLIDEDEIAERQASCLPFRILPKRK